MLVSVRDGRAISVRGDPDHPYTRGALCAKVVRYPERVYSPARLITIDPYRTRTAAQSDQHLQLAPGTDAALALGLMHVILAEGLEDHDYLARHAQGLDELRTRAAEWPPARVAQVTGLTEDEI